MEIPTLLIGLGGLGSHIVDEIYGLIPSHKRSRVAVLAFDTNINDIKKLKYIKASNVIQTSSSRTVRQYLGNTDESVKEWFPYEQGEILRKSLTDGAGQVRSVSRLAYRAALEEGKLGALVHNLNRIFKINDQNKEASPRVMIVTTLAGGTGAGIFQQTALFVRDVLEQIYNRKNVLIRGTFMMPDILVNSNKIKRGKQIKNIQANAYACIRELNAITKNAQIASERKMTIEMEYKPNQVDAQGKLVHTLTSEHLPYDFSFFYDFENVKGENLQYFENYIQQIVKSTYLDLFSPISAGRFSKQDNEIIGLIEEKGLNRYCGSGVASITYPYKDMVEYCSLKWITDSLGKDWLTIDEQYRKDMMEYKKMLNMGGNADKPHRGDRFIFHLEKMATDEKPKPFFKAVYRDAFLSGKDGELGRNKAALFVEAIEQEVDRLIYSDKKLQALSENLDIDQTKLKNRRHAMDEVIDMEEAMGAYQRAIFDFINKTRNYLINQIVLADEDAPNMMEGKTYHLNTWILGQPEAIHPVSVRFVLYQIDLLLERLLGNLNEDNDNTLRSIKGYQSIYDDPETDDIIEDAELKVEEALDQGIAGRLFKNKFKEFIKIYREHTAAHKANLNKYRKNKLLADAYAGVRKAVMEMIRDFERYFENLDEVKDRLLNDLNLLANKHDKTADPTQIFVLAKKEHKEKFWDEIGLNMLGAELPAEISHQIYAGQYKRFCIKQRGDYITEEQPEKVEQMFRSDVVGWCNKELLKEDRLNLNVIQALKRQAQLEGTDSEAIDQYLEQEISKLNQLANPFVPKPNRTEYTTFDAWGIHPESKDQLSESSYQNIFIDDVNNNEAFSPYEIIRNKTVYSLSIDDFPKFHCGDSEKAINPGNYYIAYQERINKLNEGETITPHLDKRWHSPYYLPELHEANVERTNKNIVRSLALGLMMGIVEAAEKDGDHRWLFHGKDYDKWVPYGDRLSEPDLFSLNKALTQNMGLVDAIIHRTEEIMSKDKRNHGTEYKEYTFCKNASNIFYAPANDNVNILDIFLKYNDYHTMTPSEQDHGRSLIRELFNEVKGIFLDIFGEHQPKTSAEEALKFIKNRLLRSSTIYKEAEAQSMLKKNINNLIDQFLDNE